MKRKYNFKGFGMVVGVHLNQDGTYTLCMVFLCKDAIRLPKKICEKLMIERGWYKR